MRTITRVLFFAATAMARFIDLAPGEGTFAPMALDAVTKERFLNFAVMTLDEVGSSSAGCESHHGVAAASEDFKSGCTKITSAAHNVAGKDEESLHLSLSCAGGTVFNVTLLEEEESGDLTMTDLAPKSLLPKCAQAYLMKKMNEVRAATCRRRDAQPPPPLTSPHAFALSPLCGRTSCTRSRRTRTKRPSSKRRMPSSARAPTRSAATSAALWPSVSATAATRTSPGPMTARVFSPPPLLFFSGAQPHPHPPRRHLGQRVTTKRYVRHRARAHTSVHAFGLGDTTSDADLNRTRANTIPWEYEHVYANSMPTSFDPTAGTPCLEGYSARNQGSCGSCYAFATSSALALQACVVKARNGVDATDSPMLTAQGLISCGSARTSAGGSKYTNGCDGGSGPMSFQYAIDFGLTSVGCWPYQQAEGSFENHFNTNGLALAECRDSCVPESSVGTMKFTSGTPGASALSYDTESNIAAAMRSFGALYCRFDVYSNFMQYSGGVYMGAGSGDSKSGGHAVVCYGFGTTSDGTPYWDCLNSSVTSDRMRAVRCSSSLL